MAENTDLTSIQTSKKQAEEKVKELETALANARKSLEDLEVVESNSMKNSNDSDNEDFVEESKPTTTPKANTNKDFQKKKEEQKNLKDVEKLERKKKIKAIEAKQIADLKTSIANRAKGKVAAEPGNEKVKHTACEVFIFCVDDNQIQLKVLLEKFKNTRSFKKAKGFTSGEELLKYLKTRRFPKKSIIMVVMDFFLENSDDIEAQNGINVLADIKEYDPDIEVIMLSSSGDADIAAAAENFGAVTFIQKGNEAFNKIVNNIVWKIREKEQIRKASDTKKAVKGAIIVFVLFIVALLATDVAMKGRLGIAWWIKSDTPVDVNGNPIIPGEGTVAPTTNPGAENATPAQ